MIQLGLGLVLTQISGLFTPASIHCYWVYFSVAVFSRQLAVKNLAGKYQAGTNYKMQELEEIYCQGIGSCLYSKI
jgi:hypothetical protein